MTRKMLEVDRSPSRRLALPKLRANRKNRNKSVIQKCLIQSKLKFLMKVSEIKSMKSIPKSPSSPPLSQLRYRLCSTSLSANAPIKHWKTVKQIKAAKVKMNRIWKWKREGDLILIRYSSWQTIKKVWPWSEHQCPNILTHQTQTVISRWTLRISWSTPAKTLNRILRHSCIAFLSMSKAIGSRRHSSQGRTLTKSKNRRPEVLSTQINLWRMQISIFWSEITSLILSRWFHQQPR